MNEHLKYVDETNVCNLSHNSVKNEKLFRFILLIFQILLK